MILSMTGYGRTESQFRGRKLVCEIRSLNSKAMDMSVRLQPELRAHELEIRTLITQRVERGKVEIAICYQLSDASSQPSAINWSAAKEYARQYGEQFGEPVPAEVMGAILRFPDVTKSGEEGSDLTDEEWQAVQTQIARTLDEFVAFRTQEGAALQAMFTEKLDGIAALLAQVEPFEKGRVAKIKERLEQNLAQLSAQTQAEIDRNRLEQEMIYYLEKLDITEEKVRLANHIKYFRETMENADAVGVGKKLGFIAQEMGRESFKCVMIYIFCAPSGSGKSTMVKHLLTEYPGQFELSVSCTTRAPRGEEVNGREYYFISVEEFQQRIAGDEFIEYEQVYEGLYYGTLKAEIERIEQAGHQVLFDVDVKGGLNLKRILGDRALSVFICPPSIEELRRRLVGRGDTSAEMIEKRLAKAEYEMSFKPQFDRVIVNDDLPNAFAQLDKLIAES